MRPREIRPQGLGWVVSALESLDGHLPGPGHCRPLLGVCVSGASRESTQEAGSQSLTCSAAQTQPFQASQAWSPSAFSPSIQSADLIQLVT